MKNSILCILLFTSSLIFSQKDYCLEGKLGKSTIYLKIDEFPSDTEINATYFYQNSLKDIQLRGTRRKNFFELSFKDSNDEKVLEKFELTKSSKNSFKGFWVNKTGKKIPLTLNSIDFSKYPTTKTDDSDSKLNAVKMKFIEFKQDSISKYNGKEFVWFSEKHCNSSFFRLGNNFSEKNKSVVNPILNSIQIENTLSQLNCSSSFEYSNGEGIEYTVSIQFMNTNLLGFQIFSSWFCGGAHPDFGGAGYLIDLNNGKQYDIDDIIAFDKSVTTEEKGGFDAFSKYRTDFFAPKLLDLINESEHFVKPEENSEDNCDYTNLEYWNFVSWNFTEKGIEFTPYFYRAARNCDNPFLVPFEKLEKYRNEKFPYYFK